MVGAEQIRSHAGLRGIAAVLVVAYHLQFADHRLWFESATLLFKRSYLFVDLFFILSGFILSYTNAADHPRPLTAARYREFMGRRFVRLYPLLLFTLVYLLLGHILLSAAYEILHRPNPVKHEDMTIFWLQLVMLNAWHPRPEAWNLPSWSISAEMFAYLLFPLLVAIRSHRPRIGMALLGLTPIVFYGWIATHSGSLDIIGGTAPFRCLAGFSLGMILFQLRRRFTMPPLALAIVQIAAVVGIVALLAIRVNDVFLIPCFAALVGTSWQDRGPIARLLARPAPVALGDISYSIYLNHACLGSLMAIPWGSAERQLHFDPTLARIAWIVLLFGVVLGVSRLTYRFIEIPGRRWLAKRLLGHPVGAIAHSAAAP